MLPNPRNKPNIAYNNALDILLYILYFKLTLHLYIITISIKLYITHRVKHINNYKRL